MDTTPDSEVPNTYAWADPYLSQHGSTAGQTSFKPLKPHSIPPFNADETEELKEIFDLDGYYSDTTLEPDDTSTAMVLDTPQPSCDAYHTLYQTNEGSPTPSRRSRHASTAPWAAPTAPARDTVSRSPSHDSRNYLSDPLSDAELGTLARLTDAQMQSFLASRSGGSAARTQNPPTVHHTRQLTQKTAAEELTATALGVLEKRMVKELGTSKAAVIDTLRSYPPGRR